MERLKEYSTWRPGWPVLIDQLIKPAMTTHVLQAKLLIPRRRGPCDWTTYCDLRVACYLCGMRHLAASAWNFTQIKLLRETFCSAVMTQCRWTFAALPMRHCVMRIAYLFTQVIFLRNNFRNNYLLPVTYYLLRVTYYLLPVTYYLLRISLNQALGCSLSWTSTKAAASAEAWLLIWVVDIPELKVSGTLWCHSHQ